MNVEVELVLQAIKTYLYGQLDQLTNKGSNNSFNASLKKIFDDPEQHYHNEDLKHCIKTYPKQVAKNIL